MGDVRGSARYLLDQFAEHFGLEGVEGKQNVIGLRSGTAWEIDAKGVRRDGAGFVIVECRRYTTSRQSQERVGGLAYRIIDMGAEGGIVVSPLGLQEGAELIAKAENITSVILNEGCTTTEYVMQFLNSVMVGLEDRITVEDALEIVLKDRNGNIIKTVKA